MFGNTLSVVRGPYPHDEPCIERSIGRDGPEVRDPEPTEYLLVRRIVGDDAEEIERRHRSIQVVHQRDDLTSVSAGPYHHEILHPTPLDTSAACSAVGSLGAVGRAQGAVEQRDQLLSRVHPRKAESIDECHSAAASRRARSRTGIDD
jgi:hypothetical protein